MRQLEICAGSIESVLAAQKGGADRVELCVGLDEGGLTPSVGLMRAAVAVQGIRKHVLIRPRGGDFLYTEAEKSIMLDDILAAKEMGADGVVIGALTCDGDVDTAAVARFVEAADGMSVTFHRAFDVLRDAELALEQLIDLGISRILTSGQASTAMDGTRIIRHLIQKSQGRISIMPGCGVTPDNIVSLLNETEAMEVHASARDYVRSGMVYRRSGVNMGKPGTDEYLIKDTSARIVAKMANLIKKMP